MDPETINLLEGKAQRLVDAQLEEVARIDSRARELLGFIGVVLALLAATVSQSGHVSGVWGGLFHVSVVIAVVLLLWAGLRSVEQVVEPPDYRDIDAGTLRAYSEDPATADKQRADVEGELFNELLAAAGHNAGLLERGHLRLAEAYGAFAAGLGCAIVAIMFLVVSLL